MDILSIIILSLSIVVLTVVTIGFLSLCFHIEGDDKDDDIEYSRFE